MVDTLRGLALVKRAECDDPEPATRVVARKQLAALTDAADELEALGQEPAATEKALEVEGDGCSKCGFSRVEHDRPPLHVAVEDGPCSTFKPKGERP